MSKLVPLILALAVGASACGSKSTTKSSGSAKASAAAATSSGSAAPASSAKAEVDLKKVLDDKSGKKSGKLAVDLSKVDDKAPPLGGTPKAPPPPAGAEVVYFPVGSLSFMNPGWKKHEKDDLQALEAPPEMKSGLILTTFDTEENGAKRVDAIVAQFGLRDVEWQPAQAVSLGEKEDIPSLLGIGHGVNNDDGKGVNLFFVLMKTGEPLNVLAIGGTNEDGPEEALDMTAGIVALARRGGGGSNVPAPAPAPAPAPEPGEGN